MLNFHRVESVSPALAAAADAAGLWHEFVHQGVRYVVTFQGLRRVEWAPIDMAALERAAALFDKK